MTTTNLRNSSPITNSVLTQFATEIDKHLVVNHNIQCPVDAKRVHVSIKRNIFSMCLSKAEWFGLPVNTRTQEGKLVPKHGIRQIRGHCEYSEMRIVDSSLKKSTNLVSNLLNIEKMPWQRISKSVREMNKRRIEIIDLDFSDTYINDYFLLMMEWIKSRKPYSNLSSIDINSLLACSKAPGIQMNLTVLKIDDSPAAIIWTIRSKFERSAYFISTSFDESFSKLSPGTFLLYSVGDILKDSGYIWFDLGSGHHSYKKPLSTNCYEKYIISSLPNKSLIEHFYNKLTLKPDNFRAEK